jgi:stage III sporulation protein AH
MKEKWKAFGAKCLSFVRRAGTRGLIALCAVLILGGAIAANYILNEGKGGPSKLAVDLTKDGNGEDGEDPEARGTDTVSAGDAQEYFASISLERRKARDEAIEVLRTVTESETATGEARAEAVAAIETIAKGMESEANIESLLKAKGYEQCAAVIRDGACSVIVRTDGLMQSDVARISEIVWEQAGIEPENLKIIEQGE